MEEIYLIPSQTTNVITESQISLDDFNILKVIGRGSYAKVLMVELKNTKQIYAMKVIKKALVMDEEVSAVVRQEPQPLWCEAPVLCIVNTCWGLQLHTQRGDLFRLLVALIISSVSLYNCAGY